MSIIGSAIDTSTGLVDPLAQTAAQAAQPVAASAPVAAPTLSTGASGTSQVANPAQWAVTPDQTVEGRINSILNPSNPIIQQARTRAAQTMNSRGLMNSSLAISAGDAAAYDAAIPIATADATTASKAAGYNVDQANQAASKSADAENTFKLTQINNESAKAISQLNNESAKAIKQMDIAAQAQAAQLSQANSTLLQTNSQAASAFSTAMSAVSAIQNNNSMDADTKTAAVANIWHDVQTQLKVLGSVAGLDLTSQLNFSGYPGFDDKGNYVGYTAPEPKASTLPFPFTSDGGYEGSSGSGGSAS